MTFNPDDPKYTAYVLGELNDAERAAVDAELHADPRVTALVAEIQTMTQSLAQELRSEALPALAKNQREEILAAANKPIVASRSNGKHGRRIAWIMAISASLLLAAGGGWVLRGLSTETAIRSVSSNNMQQLGLATENYEEQRLSVPPSDGDVSPSAVVGLDPTGSATRVQGIQFRQGSFKGLTPPMSGFETAAAQSNVSDPNQITPMQTKGDQSSSNSINGFRFADRDDGYVGGQAVTNLAIGTAPGSNAYGIGYGGVGTLIASHGADGKQLEVSGGTKALPLVGNSTPFSTNLASRPPIVKHLASEMISNGSVGTVNGTNTYTGGTTLTGGTLAISGNNDWTKQNQWDYSHAGVVLGDKATTDHEFNTESYDPLVDNQFLAVADNPLSTFSIDVDTASYSNVRRFLLQQNQLPPAGAVRIEELINYFRYEYPQPEGDRPFSVTTEVASCPWQAEHRLVRIGLKGREIPADKRPFSNLVFLIDVSGSMEEPNRLPLVQQSLKLLAEQLGENDHVAIVVYAGNSGLVLPSTRGDKRQEIIAAIERLRAGGSTNGGQGIELAYEIASRNFIKGGVNRVILATDGDFNVGITNQDDLVRLIQEKAKTGVFLTTLGFGFGNLKDSTMQKLADKGNGNNYYIDSLAEARKVLVEQMGGTLVTIAKDVKIQIEFNPQEVAGYRLIGYEKRMLAKEDFNNDKIDAGEIGAGHTVTALYEVVPTKGVRGQESGVSNLAPGSAGGSGAESSPNSEGGRRKAEDGRKLEDVAPAVDPLKYVKPAELTVAAKSGELFTLKLRYKQPDGDKSALIETPIKDAGRKYGEASADFKFAAAVASFGMILRDSQFKGNATLAAVQELAGEGLQHRDGEPNGKDHSNDTEERQRRGEFVQLVERAKSLKGP
jgi:Ca-activated chloride channel homolog